MFQGQANQDLLALWESVSPEFRLLAAMVMRALADVRDGRLYDFVRGRWDICPPKREAAIRQDAQEFLEWVRDTFLSDD